MSAKDREKWDTLLETYRERTVDEWKEEMRQKGKAKGRKKT